MKADGLSVPSKRGALKSLTGQLADSVGYGAYQIHRAYHSINNPHINVEMKLIFSVIS